MAKTVVSITDFGANASVVLQTEKIQKAIDFCFKQGGGEVQIPEGTFLSGGIRLRSNVTLHLLKNAVLKGSRNPEDYFGYLADEVEPLNDELITDGVWSRCEFAQSRDYRFMRIPGSRWNNALIRAINAENVAIIGEEGAILDGSDCYDELGEECYRGPHCVGMYYCRNISFRGYTVKDSANWAHSIFYSENIAAENVTMLAGHDGIHITGCDNVRIEDCTFHTGDDCVAGFANVNVLVKGCDLNSACSALRFGGTNVLIEKCHLYGPCKYLFRGSLTVDEKKNGVKPTLAGHRNNMLSAFTYYSDFSVPVDHQPGNIIIFNCKIDNADRFLHFNYSGNEPWQQNKPLQSIRFERIEATGIQMPLTAYGDVKAPVTLELKNVNVAFKDGCEDIRFMHLCNYERMSLVNVTIANYKSDSLIRTWSDGHIEMKNLTCDVPDDKLIEKSHEEFVCRPI